MNDRNFEERSNSPLIVEGNTPVVFSGPFTDKVPIEKAFFNEAPVVGTVTEVSPTEVTVFHDAPEGMNTPASTVLLNPEESEPFRARWNEIQSKFIDEPRVAVQQADDLVSEVIARIIQIFANEHSLLDGQWNQGQEVSTEDLRKVLQHYRSFFNRLVV